MLWSLCIDAERFQKYDDSFGGDRPAMHVRALPEHGGEFGRG
jgi:hypothetical protein